MKIRVRPVLNGTCA